MPNDMQKDGDDAVSDNTGQGLGAQILTWSKVSVVQILVLQMEKAVRRVSHQ